MGLFKVHVVKFLAAMPMVNKLLEFKYEMSQINFLCSPHFLDIHDKQRFESKHFKILFFNPAFLITFLCS